MSNSVTASETSLIDTHFLRWHAASKASRSGCARRARFFYEQVVSCNNDRFRRPALRFQRFDDRYQLRLESGEELGATLKSFCTERQIGFAQMTGLGAVRRAPRSRTGTRSASNTKPTGRDDQMEVVSLIGNVAIRDDEPFSHIHLGLGRSDLTLIGGHFNAAVAHPMLEIWLTPIDATVTRVLDESCGLYLMDLAERTSSP